MTYNDIFITKKIKKLLKEFGRNYFKLLPENKEIILKKYGFEKTKDKLKELKYFAVLLYEFHLGEELKVENGEVVCEKCGNNYKINKKFLKKIRESGTHCIECKILDNKKFSKGEKELLDFIRENFQGKILENNKTVLDGLELDIYLKELNCGIEYNGNYHHRNQKVNLKQKRCEEKSINFILVWEDLWLSKKEIVKKEVLRKLKIGNKIENTENFSVKEITKQKAKEFLNKNHLYGFEKETNVHLGLFNSGKLVSVISIKNNGNSSFTIGKFSSICHIENDFKHFIEYFKENFDWKEIIYTTNEFWENGDFLIENGFEFIKRKEAENFYGKSQKRYDKPNGKHFYKFYDLGGKIFKLKR